MALVGFFLVGQRCALICGCGWDYDYAFCPCGYNKEFTTSTYPGPDLEIPYQAPRRSH